MAESGELSFENQTLKLQTAADAADVVKQIQDYPNLQSLCLSGNTIGVEAAKAIAAALADKKSLKRALWSDMFTGRLRSEVPPALEALGNALISSGAELEELDLSDNAFGPDGVKAVTHLLTSRACFSLHTLKFHNNGLGIGGGKILSEALLKCCECAKAAGKLFAPRRLICGRNRLEDDGAIALAQAVKEIGSLEEIAMFQNFINPPGVAALAEAFYHNKNLQRIDLRDNTFTATGASAMAKVLPALQGLHMINFDDCLVRSEGFHSFASVFSTSCHQLKEVHLAFNEAKASSGQAVARALSTKQNLTYVNLNGNIFGSSGREKVKQLLGGLADNKALQTLSDDDSDDGNDLEDWDAPSVQEKASGSLEDQLANLSLPPMERLTATTAGQALCSPTSNSLCQLSRQPDLLQAALKDNGGHLQTIVSAFSMTCNLVQQGDAQSAAAKIVASSLVKEAVSRSEYQPTAFMSDVLVELGLLKSECVKEIRADIVGGLILLDHVVNENILPSDCISILTAFITKPHRLLGGQAAEHRHQLLQSLYTR